MLLGLGFNLYAYTLPELITQAKEIHNIKAMFKGEDHEAIDEESDLATLEGVKQFPVRLKCALLPWTTLEEAWEESDETG